MTRRPSDPRPRAPGVGPFAPLRSPVFTSCWLGGTIAHGASWMQNIAVPYLVFDMTGSATWLGIAAVAAQAPSLLGSPLGGLWADRHSKRALLMLTSIVKALVAMAFYALYQEQALTPLVMVGLLCVSGFAAAVNVSAWQSFVGQIVPERLIAPAYRLNAIQFSLSRAAGPALGGWVMAEFGAGTAFLVNAAAYAPLAVALLFAVPRTLPTPAPSRLVDDLRAAARAVRERRVLWVPVVTVTVLSTLGQGLHPLMAGLARDVFRVGEQGFGWLMSSVGIASVCTTLVIIAMGERVDRSAQARIGLGVYAVGVLLVAATDVYEVALLGFAITGVGHVLVHIPCTTALQLHVPDALRGRVTSIYLMGIIVSIPVGAQIGGVLGDVVGLPAVVAAYGLGIGVYGLLAVLRLKGLRDLDEPVGG